MNQPTERLKVHRISISRRLRARLHVAALVALVAAGVEPRAGPESAAARADILTETGTTIGRADFVDIPSGVLITLQISHLLPGPHAVHLHQTGRCDPPEFESADWDKHKSDNTYEQQFVAVDQQYSRLLDLLLTQLRGAS